MRAAQRREEVDHTPRPAPTRSFSALQMDSVAARSPLHVDPRAARSWPDRWAAREERQWASNPSSPAAGPGGNGSSALVEVEAIGHDGGASRRYCIAKWSARCKSTRSALSPVCCPFSSRLASDRRRGAGPCCRMPRWPLPQSCFPCCTRCETHVRARRRQKAAPIGMVPTHPKPCSLPTPCSPVARRPSQLHQQPDVARPRLARRLAAAALHVERGLGQSALAVLGGWGLGFWGFEDRSPGVWRLVRIAAAKMGVAPACKRGGPVTTATPCGPSRGLKARKDARGNARAALPAA